MEHNVKVFVARGADTTVDVTVVDVDDLKDLRVVTNALSERDLDDALTAHRMGRVSDGYAWLDVDALRRSGPDTAAWRDDFAAMIDFAVSKGWTDAGSVRAHIDRGDV
jgi:hypothetical protein